MCLGYEWEIINMYFPLTIQCPTTLMKGQNSFTGNYREYGTGNDIRFVLSVSTILICK